MSHILRVIASAAQRAWRTLRSTPASSKVFRATGTLLLGSAAGRAVGLAAIPVLTRIYEPRDFGLLASYVALITILGQLISLRYPIALPLPRRTGTAANLAAGTVFLIIIGTIGSLVVLTIFGDSILHAVSLAELSPYLWLVPLGALLTATYEVVSLWAVRLRLYRTIAKTSVSQSVSGALAKIGLGLAGLQPAGLLIGQLFAAGGGIGSLGGAFFRSIKAHIRQVRRTRILSVANHYRDFALYRAPSQALMNLAVQAPVLFAASIYSTSTAGQIALAFSSLSTPVTFASQSMGKALYAEAARLGPSQAATIKTMAHHTQLRLLAIGLIPAAALFFAAPQIFSYFFGEKWAESGQYASALSGYLLFQFTSAPLVQLLNLNAKQKLFLIINLFRCAIVAACFLLAKIVEASPLATIQYYSAVMCAFFLATSFLAIKMVGKPQ